MPEIIPIGAKIRATGATNPELHNRVGTVQAEPEETPGVVCVLWDGTERVTWIRFGEVEEIDPKVILTSPNPK